VTARELPANHCVTPRSHSALLLVLALTACSVPEEQEVALGAQAADEINSELPLVQDEAIATYVTNLGTQIALGTTRADLKWRFFVVDSPQINAFALPGGFIYVNRGLIEATRSHSELAGVLGHEIGHVVQRHSVEQMGKHATANIGVAVLCALTSACESGLGQAAIEMGGSLVLTRYSRRDEFEADSEAVINVVRAGIDPKGVPRFFERLLNAREYQPSRVESWFTSHPLEEDRIYAAHRLIDRLPEKEVARVRDDARDYPTFLRRVAALPPSPPPPKPEEFIDPLP
jgi:beta-barrel assembly-enhancing protease